MRKIEVQEILRLVQLCHRVLDVGCGCGYHDVVFALSEKVEEVTGIDYSSRSIEQANCHYPHPKIKRQTADVFELIDKSPKFNLTTLFQVILQVIEHLSNPQEFLVACANCVVDNGYIAVVTPNRERLQNRVLKLLGRKPLLVDPLHFTEYTIAELIEMGRKANLTCVGYFGHSMSLSFKGFTFIGGTSSFAISLGKRIPKWSNVIGVVFERKIGK